jgi:hypothetical protein
MAILALIIVVAIPVVVIFTVNYVGRKFFGFGNQSEAF